MTSKVLTPVLAAAVAAAGSALGFRYGEGVGATQHAAPGSVTMLLGQPLPPVSLVAAGGGTAVDLGELTRDRPTLLVIAGTTDCLGCANFPLEARVLRNRFPRIRTLVVGSGADTSMFRAYFRRESLTDAALLDPERALLRKLGTASEPLVLLVGSTGTILYADDRIGSASSQFSISRLLGELARGLGCSEGESRTSDVVRRKENR